MRRLIDNKGAAHFEMIVSFVFFVGFVFFLFLVLKPHETTTLSGAVIKGFHNSFEKEVSTNLSMVFLKTNSFAGSCFIIDLPLEIFDYGVTDEDSYVIKLSGEEVSSDIVGNDLSVGSLEGSFRVGISPEFDEGASGACTLLSDDEYILGSVIERKVISYSALVEMKDKYYEDYDSLKNELRIPSVYDYAIIGESLLEVQMIPASGVLDSSDVMADDFLMEVLYSNGTIINERFGLKVW